MNVADLNESYILCKLRLNAWS